MKPILLIMTLILVSFGMYGQGFEKDKFTTDKGELEITFIGHGTLMMNFNNKVIYFDPVSMVADFSKMPKADLILITHEHSDHLDSKSIDQLTKSNTTIILTAACAKVLGKGDVMANGETKDVSGISIAAVPAYNIDKAFHPKGNGNGYVIGFGNKKVYVAGDTDNVPEMAQLKNIDIAFLPMNMPYTMTPAMVAEAAREISPKVLYPYHFGETKTDELLTLLKNDKNIEVRIKKLN